MKVTVIRQPSQVDWTLSAFFFDGVKKGVGIEDEYRTAKVKGETRIPNGIYKLGLRVSPRFSNSFFRDDNGNIIESAKRTTPELKKKYHTAHELVWVLNVPNFDFILWHWGNTDDDTDGCYIVGSAFGTIGKQAAVLNSRKKYIEIYPLLYQAIKSKECTVEYKEENPLV